MNIKYFLHAIQIVKRRDYYFKDKDFYRIYSKLGFIFNIFLTLYGFVGCVFLKESKRPPMIMPPKSLAQYQ